MLMHLSIKVQQVELEQTEPCQQSPKRNNDSSMVRATQKGEMENPSPEVAQHSASMSKKSDVKKFASTEHDKLGRKEKDVQRVH